MACALEADYRDGVGACLLSGEGVSDGGALMDELDLVMLVISAVFLLPAAQQLIVGLGVVAGGLYNGDMLLISGPKEKLGIVVIVSMRQHGDVQAEGMTIGKLAALGKPSGETGLGSGGVGVDHENGRADDAEAAGL